MSPSRRSLFSGIGTLLGILAVHPLVSAFAASAAQTPQPLPSPHAPNPNYPPGLNGPDITPPDRKKLDQQKQADVRADVEKLFGMVSELREQIQKTDSSSVLSVSVVRKAQQIEKLAKQIKDLAKG
jgi:hypothetical protein